MAWFWRSGIFDGRPRYRGVFHRNPEHHAVSIVTLTSTKTSDVLRGMDQTQISSCVTKNRAERILSSFGWKAALGDADSGSSARESCDSRWTRTSIHGTKPLKDVFLYPGDRYKSHTRSESLVSVSERLISLWFWIAEPSQGLFSNFEVLDCIILIKPPASEIDKFSWGKEDLLCTWKMSGHWIDDSIKQPVMRSD